MRIIVLIEEKEFYIDPKTHTPTKPARTKSLMLIKKDLTTKPTRLQQHWLCARTDP
jgi:hypothetical protein